MKPVKFIVAATLATAFLASSADTTPREDSHATAREMMAPEAARADLALARRALETIHPGYARYTPKAELDAIWADMEAAAEAGVTRERLYVDLSRLLAAIRCDHTKAELPDDIADARNVEATYLPFRFVLFDGRMYADTVAENGPLKRGEEILSIDGRPVAEWISQVADLVPVDGDADRVKPLAIAYSTEFMGGALDHFAPLIETLSPLAKLHVRRDGEIVEVAAERLTYPAYQALIGEVRYSRNFVDSVRFERLGDQGAYLAVDTFVNYRQPVDAMAHLAPYFQILKDERRTKLIVDLRKNGGGSNDAQEALLAHLINAPLAPVESVFVKTISIDPDVRARINTWDAAALDPDPAWFEPAGDGTYRVVAPEAGAPSAPIAPAPDAFDGDLAFLTGPGNASGVTHLLAALRGAGRGLMVGEPTGGAPTGATANVIFFLELPESGITVRVPAQRTLIANSERLPQRTGLSPDVAAPQTAATYFAGRDPALDAARDALGL